MLSKAELKNVLISSDTCLMGEIFWNKFSINDVITMIKSYIFLRGFTLFCKGSIAILYNFTLHLVEKILFSIQVQLLPCH